MRRAPRPVDRDAPLSGGWRAVYRALDVEVGPEGERPDDDAARDDGGSGR